MFPVLKTAFLQVIIHLSCQRPALMPAATSLDAPGPSVTTVTHLCFSASRPSEAEGQGRRACPPSLTHTRQQLELFLCLQFEMSKHKTSSWFSPLQQDPRPRAAAAPTLTSPQHSCVEESMPHVGVWSCDREDRALMQGIGALTQGAGGGSLSLSPTTM